MEISNISGRYTFLSCDGKKTSFEHRRQWIVKRMIELSDIFSIGICSYSVMSNHYHIVVKVSDNKLCSATQTLKTWNRLYNLPYLCEKFLKNKITTKAELRQVKIMVKMYRKRLMNISWFMKKISGTFFHVSLHGRR